MDGLMSAGPLQIALVTTRYWPAVGGAERYAYGLANALARRHQVQVVTRLRRTGELPPPRWFTASEAPARTQEGPLVVTVVAPRRWERPALQPVHRLHYYRAGQWAAIGLFTAVYAPKLAAAVPGVDVVHFGGTGRDLFGFAALRLARRRGARFVVTPHVHPGAWGDGDLDLALYRRADRVIAHTNHEREHLIGRGLPADRVAVVGIGADPTLPLAGPSFRERYQIGGPLIVFIGRRAPYKGYQQLRAAAELVWTRRPEARFAFIGPASVAGDRLCPDQRVLDLDQVDEAEKQAALAGCDVCCIPSAAESFGIVYLEAWQHARPVIGGPAPAARELIGDDGIVLATQEPAEIAGAILRLLEQPVLARELGARGHAKWRRQFTWEAIAARVVEQYRAPRQGGRR